MRNTIRFWVVMGLAVSSVACTHVAPYERGLLAHPSMTSDEVAGVASQHVYEVHEGAAGGELRAAASGCGCN